MSDRIEMERVDMSKVGDKSGIPFLLGNARKRFVYDKYHQNNDREDLPIHIQISAPNKFVYNCIAGLFPMIDVREIMLCLARDAEVYVLFHKEEQADHSFPRVLSGSRCFSRDENETTLLLFGSKTMSFKNWELVHADFPDRDQWLESSDVEGFESRLIDRTLNVIKKIVYRYLLYLGFSSDVADASTVELG